MFNEEILDEYRTVLLRPSLKFSVSQIDSLLAKIIKYGEHIVIEESTNPMPDESDRKFYDVAGEQV